MLTFWVSSSRVSNVPVRYEFWISNQQRQPRRSWRRIRHRTMTTLIGKSLWPVTVQDLLVLQGTTKSTRKKSQASTQVTSISKFRFLVFLHLFIHSFQISSFIEPLSTSFAYYLVLTDSLEYQQEPLGQRLRFLRLLSWLLRGTLKN